MDGEEIAADISWDDGDASSRHLVLYDPAQGATTWPRWKPSSLAKTPLLLRLGRSQGDLLRAPSCGDAEAPEASATPSGVFGAAIDSGRLGNSLLATGLGGQPPLPPYPLLTD